jgi:hypothetical protein
VTAAHHSYAVRPWLVATFALGAVVSCAIAVASAGPGRFLFAVPGIAAAVEALRGGFLRPTLAADPEGIEVVVGLRRERHPWSAITHVGVLGPPSSGARLRRRANAVEVDLGDRLIVVAGYRLGAPVSEVAATLSGGGGDGGF